MSEKVKQIVTDSIIEQLENGTIPWRAPWIVAQNGVSKRNYRGSNSVLLSVQAGTNGNPYFFSFKQVGALGGSVRKGERGHIAVFVNFPKNETENEKKTGFFMRYYRVWNATQCDDLPEEYTSTPEKISDVQARKNAQAIVDGFFARAGAPRRTPVTGSAHYAPNSDSIAVPSQAGMRSEADYYCSLFHEMAHSTGADTRLDRKLVTLQSSEGYAKEELTAEICAAMLACHAGITPAAPDNSAAYVAAWLKALQNDRSLIFAAASQAQKAFDYILGNAEESENNIPTEVRATGTDGAGDIAATIEAPKPRVTKQRASEYIDLL